MDNSDAPTIRVLMVEDDDDDALLTSTALRETKGRPFDVISAKKLAAALDCLRRQPLDVVLLDLFLPDSRGLESLVAVRRESAHVPIVVLTGLADEATAIEALHRGAQDYLSKSALSGDTVGRSIRHAIERQRLVTSLRAANELLSDRNARLSELCETAHRFVDNVSHEFRTPLTVIKEFSSLLNEGLCGALSAEQRHATQVISDRADDLTLMVNDMMDVSRLRAGILNMWRSASRLADIIEHLRPMLERRSDRNKVHLRIEAPDDLPAVYCDAGKVGQVITNLVINAIKFTGGDGHVLLWARVDSPTRVAVGVTDEGAGIAPEKLQEIFERFTQLNQDIDSSTKGVGLGLAIVKDFVALNLGELSVESAPGKGSTFAFTLAQADPRAVLDCYLNGLRARDPMATVGLLEVRTRAECDDANLAAIDKFLQSAVRPEDVTYMIAPGRWLLLIRGPLGSEVEALDRIRAAWSETCRNWTHGRAPELALVVRGNWRAERAEELCRQFNGGTFRPSRGRETAASRA